MKKIAVFLSMLTIALAGCTQTRLLTEDEMDARMELLLFEDAEALIQPAGNLGGYAYKSRSHIRKLTFLACEDSDGGKRYEEWGKVSAKYMYGEKVVTQTLSDVCDGTKLREYYCSGRLLARDTYLCSNACEDGACVSKI